jgi:hypothetical protein
MDGTDRPRALVAISVPSAVLKRFHKRNILSVGVAVERDWPKWKKLLLQGMRPWPGRRTGDDDFTTTTFTLDPEVWEDIKSVWEDGKKFNVSAMVTDILHDASD